MSEYTNNRREAMQWWNELLFKDKVDFTSNTFPDRLVATLTGREIQILYDINVKSTKFV